MTFDKLALLENREESIPDGDAQPGEKSERTPGEFNGALLSLEMLEVSPTNLKST